MTVTRKNQTLSANAAMMEALRSEERERTSRLATQEAERTERAEIREGIQDRITRAKDAKEEVEEVTDGPVRILTRDGLLWLIQKRRLNESQRTAAERYRRDYAKAHAGEIKVLNIGDVGGRGVTNHIEVKLEAIRKLKDAQDKGLLGDQALVSLMNMVAGQGKTLIAVAHQDRKTSDALEVEFRVGCRLLARHYGFAS